MKKSKIFIVLVLIFLVIIESYFFFEKDDDKKEADNTILPLGEKINKDDEKYIVDITTSYELNALDFKEIKDGSISYHSIKGLKNNEIEDKINREIKDRIYLLKDKKSGNSKYEIYTEVEGSFENVLSIKFIIKTFLYSAYGSDYYESDVGDVYNCDLNTGDELSIDDVVLNKSILRSALVNNANEDITKKIGFVCNGGPCANPDPDYGKVEDAILSIVNQYNKDNYMFSFSEQGITLYFKNVYVPNPEEYYDDQEGHEKCSVYTEKIGNEEYDRYICQNNYEEDYTTFIDYFNLTDTLIIYDKFKSSENIFNNNKEKINRKFMKTNIGNDWSMYEVMEETENKLVDYNLNTLSFTLKDTELLDELKNKVIKESLELEKDKFNIYNINGNVESIGNDKYYYVYFEVSHYNLDKDKYLENKKQIYLDKHDKMFVGNIDEAMSYKTEYEYLKDFLTKKNYYFYIIDDNGKEYDTRDILNNNFNFSSYIPNEWLSLGKYKSIDELVNNAFLMNNELVEFNDRLVIYDDGFMNLKFKYKGKEVDLASEYFEKDNIRNMMYK